MSYEGVIGAIKIGVLREVRGLIDEVFITEYTRCDTK
jgi:hypothetical protein